MRPPFLTAEGTAFPGGDGRGQARSGVARFGVERREISNGLRRDRSRATAKGDIDARQRRGILRSPSLLAGVVGGDAEGAERRRAQGHLDRQSQDGLRRYNSVSELIAHDHIDRHGGDGVGSEGGGGPRRE